MAINDEKKRPAAVPPAAGGFAGPAGPAAGLVSRITSRPTPSGPSGAAGVGAAARTAADFAGGVASGWADRVKQNAATVGRGISAAVTAPPRTGMALAEAAKPVLADFAAGFRTGTTAPLPVGGVERNIARPTPFSAQPGNIAAPTRPAMVPPTRATPTLTAPAGDTSIGPPTAAAQTQGLLKSGANFFSGSNTGVRVLRPDGTPTAAQGQPQGAFNTVPSTAFTNPGLGTMGIAAGQKPGASVQVSRYQQEVANAQARNASTARRVLESQADPMSGMDRFQRLDVQLAAQKEGKAGDAARNLLAGSTDAAAGSLGREQSTQEQIARDKAQQADRRLANEGDLARQALADQNALARQTQADAAAATRTLSGRAPIALDDGTAALLNPDGTLSPITGADGEPAKLARAPQEGQVTPAIAFKARNEEIAALNDPLNAVMTPEQRQAARREIDARYAPYLKAGQAQQELPPRHQAAADIRRMNPNATDEEIEQALAEFYK